MQVFECPALSNLTHMAAGRELWRAHSNDLWHWFKHTKPLILNSEAITKPDLADVRTMGDYVSLARTVCRHVMAGDPGAAVKRRERVRTDLVERDYLVW